MRSSVDLLALFLAAPVLFAQPASLASQETARARQLLQSPQWLDKAWGVYMAGRLQSEDLRDPLIEEFRTARALRDAAGWSEEYAYVTTLFDAAIQADIAVPAAILEPFEEHWTDPVVILLARGADSEDSLLRLAGDNARPIVWLAANNLLCERKSPRWYARTVGEIAPTHRFTVIDSELGFGCGGTGGAMCGDGIAAMPRGFPPVAFYTLEQRSARGSVLLAKGPQNVYYERTVVPTGKQVGSGSCMSMIDRGTIRIQYLAELAHVPADRAQHLFYGATQIQYRGVEEFYREVEQALQAQEEGIRSLVESIQDPPASALAGTRLQIVPELNDRRQNAANALPSVAPREFVF